MLNTVGVGNTAVGAFALFSNLGGGFNAAVGDRALQNNTASGNTAVGQSALNSNTTGSNNTGIGASAVLTNTTGSDNTGVGVAALFGNTSGSSNVAIGKNAGSNVVSGSHNIYIGTNTQGAGDEDETVRIGDSTFSNAYSTYIVGIFNQAVDAATATIVYADANQKIGTFLLDAKGNSVPFKPRAMLEESLKQQKRIAELEATVTQQQKQIEALTAVVQKVSAQLELNKPAPQTVLNNR